MRGDILARGASSATFPSNSHIPQDKWDSIFGKRDLNPTDFAPNTVKPEKKTKRAKNLCSAK